MVNSSAQSLSNYGNETVIAAEFFRTRSGTTICAATLQNGDIAVGHSPPTSARTTNSEEDRQMALTEAQQHLWPLLSYQWLQEHLQPSVLSEVQSCQALSEDGDTTAGREPATTQPADERIL